MNNNKTLWSKQEVNYLVRCCTEMTPGLAHAKVSSLTGRTIAACSFKWGQEKRKRGIDNSPTNINWRSKAIVNRNVWSESEAKLMVSLVDSNGLVKGLDKACKQLGRTRKACKAKLDRMDNPRLEVIAQNTPSVEHILSNKTMKITYHNGSTHVMNIIAKTDGLVVAKINDVVVTIEM